MMDGNRQAARTWQRMEWLGTKSFQKRCSHIPFSKIGWIVFRLCVLTGLAATLIIMMNLQQRLHLLIKVPGAFTGYAVYNPSCKIPEYPPFHEDVRSYIEKETINCSSLPLLTSVSRPGRNSTYVLNLHETYTSHYGVDRKDLVCCYSLINTNNTNYSTIGKCRIFDTSITLSSTADLVDINCKDDRNETIYRMHHFLVPDKAEIHHKLQQFKNGNQNDDFLSVIIVGLDSVSRLNLLRSMPETVKYMEHNRWYTFSAYHKIQWNTLYNLNGPILTGLSGNQLKETCWPDESEHLDSCPYIWKNYSVRNYITAYGEDCPTWDSFKYVGFDGFRKQPTDYYLRPHMKILDDTLKPDKSFAICVGLRRAADYLLDFSTDFASRFVNHPTFSLIWINAGHSFLNGPQRLDQRFITYFRSLESSGALNRSMVVFVSDHGFQHSKFRSTYMGAVEDSLPFLYIRLPQWYRNKYPHKAENLARNKNRLVSHFDLHLTLMDVIGVKTTAGGCPKCVSLFDSVPWNRGCSDAGILGDCACDGYVEIPISPLVQRMAELVAARINSLAATYTEYIQKGYKCSKISIEKIETARRQVLGNRYFGHQYVIQAVTAPNWAHIEAVVLDTLEVQSIIEYSQYKYRSNCMDSREGKKWCTCEEE